MLDNIVKISIIMASYNYEDFINEAIDSIIKQSYTNWELVIVDDGSKDNSVNVIQNYCETDSRIKLFQHENNVNKGLKETLLLGLEKATSQWIAFLESDDLFAPNYLEEKIKIINSDKTTGLIFNDVELFGDKDAVKGYTLYLKKRKKILSNCPIKYRDLFDINIIPTFSCVMVRKDLLMSCDFNSPVQQSLDWILETQLIPKTKIIYIDKELTKWRKHTKNYSHKHVSDHKAKVYSSLLKYLDEGRHNSFWIWLYYFINTSNIEKLLRPQVKFISRLILNKLLKNKLVQLDKVN